MATPTPAISPKSNATPRSRKGRRSRVRVSAIHCAALIAAVTTAAAAHWASGQNPSIEILLALVFGRVAVAWAFRIDRLRWGEWGLQDARLWLYVTCCGSTLVVPLLTQQTALPSLRFLMVDALIYGVCGLLIDDVLRLKRQRLQNPTNPSPRRCFVIGSRGRGRRLAQILLRNSGTLAPFGYLDDDPQLEETVVDGLHVLGSIDDLARLAQLHDVHDVLTPEMCDKLHEAADRASVRVHISSPITQ